ncbi:concanavalin A-like lectin/glucanase domain-containing protein [Talaromyces proteolyticus]|uniref:Crh-like protein n=1 Tax=Talaromyces proteolyticus TaxID=1131652 RepID=A0AAD4KW60_9EURO|nr:concanavalin A-like lectin/glucanase domain-containing protein [Talaromyces proteolyticus]KAH8700337.1 concanavalin A-like lectin/glucanase domain-containing protein [Talaromyces proteolyticus]
MVRLVSIAIAALSASFVAADSAPQCGSGTKCPADTPCCSQYGECGTGAYCLGGCDPINSNSLDSCTPEPVCKSQTFASWDNLDDTASNDKYLGNATATDWVYSGKPLVNNGELLLTMAKGSVGTLVAYNHYIWYGKVSARLKTSRSAGVITAFILLSDVKDEIDYEFVGTELTTAQTNYYFQGILDWHNGKNSTVSDSTFDNYHTYEIDWTPDSITWYIDGQSTRVLNKADTYNATTRQFMYPQTPARLQLSLWPGGLATNAPGTIQWAGGEISWDTPDIKDPGYYYATFSSVNITCYDPPSGANIKGNQAYIYTDAAGTNNTVEIVNKNTVLSSLEGTGVNMTAGASSSTASGTSSSSSTGSSSSTSTSSPNTVPGEGNGGSGGQPGGSSGSGTSSGSGSGSGGSGSGTSSGSSATSTGFSQGGDSAKTGAASANEHMLQGSMFAVLVAVVALIAM